jgi:hypothetical protein
MPIPTWRPADNGDACGSGKPACVCRHSLRKMKKTAEDYHGWPAEATVPAYFKRISPSAVIKDAGRIKRPAKRTLINELVKPPRLFAWLASQKKATRIAYDLVVAGNVDIHRDCRTLRAKSSF